MTDRYITLRLMADKGKPLYVVIDRRMIFRSERKAIAERKRLNELDDSINRTFRIAEEDRKKQNNDSK